MSTPGWGPLGAPSALPFKPGPKVEIPARKGDFHRFLLSKNRPPDFGFGDGQRGSNWYKSGHSSTRGPGSRGGVDMSPRDQWSDVDTSRARGPSCRRLAGVHWGGGAISGFWALATRSKWQAPTISACDFAEIPEVLQNILCPIVTLTRILGSDATAKDSCRCDDWTEFLQVT